MKLNKKKNKTQIYILRIFYGNLIYLFSSPRYKCIR